MPAQQRQNLGEIRVEFVFCKMLFRIPEVFKLNTIRKNM